MKRIWFLPEYDIRHDIVNEKFIYLRTTKVEYEVANMARYEVGWRISLESILRKLWIWQGYIVIILRGSDWQRIPYIVGTEIPSYIKTKFLYKTRLGLWLEPPWEGGWLSYPFCDIYIFCSNMIFDLMSYMNRRYMLLRHVDYQIWARWYIVYLQRASLIDDTKPTLPPCLRS